MFKRTNKIEVVPESQYTDFSERVPGDAYATNRTVLMASAIPAVVSVGLLAHRLAQPSIAATMPVTASAPVVEATPIMPTGVPLDSLSTPEMIPTGFIADSSLEMLATVLDPLVQIMVAVSFPIASVIMIGGAFFFMLGNSEKAWQTIFNAGLGYVIIQMSPLFLDILRSVGEAV